MHRRLPILREKKTDCIASAVKHRVIRTPSLTFVCNFINILAWFFGYQRDEMLRSTRYPPPALPSLCSQLRDSWRNTRYALNLFHFSYTMILAVPYIHRQRIRALYSHAFAYLFRN